MAFGGGCGWGGMCGKVGACMVKGGHVQWRIQDFPQGGAPTPKSAIIFQFFPKNCMKMKEFRAPGGARPWRPPLDPPMMCGEGGVHGEGGHAWQRAGHAWQRGACVAKGGMHGKGGHVW